MGYLLAFFDQVLGVFEWLIIIVAIMSWLIAFNVVNLYNPVVRSVWDGLNAVVEPLLRPIRRIMPGTGGLDLSPLVLILLIELVRKVVIPNVAGTIGGYA